MVLFLLLLLLSVIVFIISTVATIVLAISVTAVGGGGVGAVENTDCLVIKLRACLHGGGGPQVGEVTRLAVVEKWPAFTCKLTTPGSRGDFT